MCEAAELMLASSGAFHNHVEAAPHHAAAITTLCLSCSCGRLREESPGRFSIAATSTQDPRDHHRVLNGMVGTAVPVVAVAGLSRFRSLDKVRLVASRKVALADMGRLGIHAVMEEARRHHLEDHRLFSGRFFSWVR